MAETKAKALDLGRHYQTADEIAEGFEHTLRCGLPVRLARANSPLFRRASLAAWRKYGRGKGETREIPPEKMEVAIVEIMAKANFLWFGGQVLCGGEVLSDSLESRVTILTQYPDLRTEIAEAVQAADFDWQEAIAAAGKD